MRTATQLIRRLAVMAMLLPSVTAAGTITYFHNDLAGSPVAATNSSGQVLWKERYRPYGERIVNSPASADNEVWFTSRRQDAETGFVYMGARYYDPVTGRFLSTDPSLFDGSVHGLNRYAYANNNPYRYLDSNGQQALPIQIAPALTPPPSVPSQVPNGLLGKPSEQQQLRALEGFSPPALNLSLPSFDATNALFLTVMGFPVVTAVQVNNLIFKDSAKLPELDSTGKVHGDIPSFVPKSATREQLQELSADLRKSIARRQAESQVLGEDAGHRDRIREEERFLRQVDKNLSGS